MTSFPRILLAAYAILFGLGIWSADAQLLGYESFADLAIGSGVSGSGSNATGWSDAGWNNAAGPRFQVVDPTPDLSYPIPGGDLVVGNDRAMLLTTAPEPTSGIQWGYRDMPFQNTTLYFSFLLRITNIGTGTDSIELRIGEGATIYARFVLTPEQGQSYMTILPLDSSGSGGGSSPQLITGQTYFIVARCSRTIARIRRALDSR